MTNRKFYRKVIRYEILSEEPIGEPNLEAIAAETGQGDWSGHFLDDEANEIVDGKRMAELLQSQGSDPEFFQLTSEGEDSE